MDVKKKLVELIENANYQCDNRDCDEDAEGCAYHCYANCWAQFIADHLIANGVTVQEWKPEIEPPKLEGTYIVETVTGAVTTARYYTPMVFPATSLRGESRREGGWQSNRKVVRWMPLPEPPKGE